MKTFLVTTALIFSIPALADDVKYSFPCETSAAVNLWKATDAASAGLMTQIENLTQNLKAKNEILSVAVTSSILKQPKIWDAEVTLCATVSYKEKSKDSNTASNLHYGFPCGLGVYENWMNKALGLAGNSLGQAVSEYRKRLEKENFQTVSVAGTLSSFNPEIKAGIMCATVAYKETATKSSAADLRPGLEVR